MAAAIAIWDVDGLALRRLSKLTKDVAQARRLLALAAVRWRLADLAQWIWEEFEISLSETTVGREVKALGFAKIYARPRHHAQNALAIVDFKKRISGRVGKGPRKPPGRNRDRAVVAG